MGLHIPQNIRATCLSLLKPTLSAFLCFVFVVIGPLNRLGGQYAFLVYTVLLLFFFPSNKLIPQLEMTCLSIAGALAGLGWTCATLAVASVCGSRYGSDSVQARVVIGVGLAILALACGFVRSYSSTLIAASRIALFFPIFILTASTGLTSMRASYFTDTFYVTCFAAAFALVPTIAFSLKSSKPQLGSLIGESISLIQQILPTALYSVLNLEDGLGHSQAASIAIDQKSSARHASLVSALRTSVAKLQPVFDDCKREVEKARMRTSTLDPVLAALRRIQRNPLLGSTSHVPGERIQAALRRANLAGGTVNRGSPTRSPRQASNSGYTANSGVYQTTKTGSLAGRAASTTLKAKAIEHGRSKSILQLDPSPVLLSSAKLVTTVVEGLCAANSTLVSMYGWPKSTTTEVLTEEPLDSFKRDLEVALSNLQRDLTQMLSQLGDWKTMRRSDAPAGHKPLVQSTDKEPPNDREHFRLAFYMTALLDLAKEVLHLQQVILSLHKQANDKVRWQLPSIYSPWTRSSSVMAFSDIPAAPDQSSTDEDTQSAEAPQDTESYDLDYITAVRYGTRSFAPENLGRAQLLWRRLWNQTDVIRVRITLSKLIHALKHSSHAHFSIKLAGGISLLSLPALLPPNHPGRAWFDETRGAWMVVSYMYVLETHTGGIMKVGVFRLLGTFIGAVIAYVSTLIANENPFGLVTLATVLTVPLSYVIMFTKYPPIATVAYLRGITMPPIMFIRYLDLDRGQSNWQLAWSRFVDIALGIVAAVLVGTMVWPNHARVRYFRSMATALDQISEYYLCMSRDHLRPSLVYKVDTKHYDRLDRDLRTHIRTCRTLVDIQVNELSLLPRPIKMYIEVVDVMDRLVIAFSEVRTLRFSVPRQATVLDVLPIRRELVSAIMVNLWALSQAFRSRSSLPQFLPSPRHALDSLEHTLDDLARKARSPNELDSQGSPADISILYGMAENAALGEVCNVLEELTAAARTLFVLRLVPEETSNSVTSGRRRS